MIINIYIHCTYEYPEGGGNGELLPLKLLLMAEELRLGLGEDAYFIFLDNMKTHGLLIVII